MDTSKRAKRPMVATSVLRLAAAARASTDARTAELLDAAAAEIERLAGQRDAVRVVLQEIHECALPLCGSCIESARAVLIEGASDEA